MFGWSRWGAVLCVLAVPWAHAPSESGAAQPRRDAALLAVEDAHARLARLMRSPDVSLDPPAAVAGMREGLSAVRASIAPARGAIRDRAPRAARAITRQLDAALSALDGDGAPLAADRAEFVVSSLLPLASTLDDAHTALLTTRP